MSTLILKFGGTSVADADAIKRVADIVRTQRAAGHRVVAVVSAMSGVTDALTRGVRAAVSGDQSVCRDVAHEILLRTAEACSQLVPSHKEREALLAGARKIMAGYESVCQSVLVLAEVTPRVLDRATACGEPLVASLLAAHLRTLGIESRAIQAEDVVVTDDTYQNAAPLLDETRSRCAHQLAPLIAQGMIPVIGGFIGATLSGVPTTLGRGGSDFSAAILGNALAADEVWIWTDVDGVMSADPRLVPGAKVIPVLSYAEVGELAYFGAAVLHPRTIRPLMDEHIPLWIKNTFHPDVEGTRIESDSSPIRGTLKAVTDVRGLSLITVEGRGMLGVPGIAARTFEAVARCQANVLMISQASSEQSICFVIPSRDVACVQASLEQAFALEIARREIDRVGTLDCVGIVTALGAGMRLGVAGVTSRLFTALDAQDVNIIAIAQGSSECSVSIVVQEQDVERAVLAIHEEVIKQ
ncbi:aspartate kinase [Candidatus Bipolaricaulota bacterium]|nr:aspartate kinase [Candidatus Bipolaricaulota bacterium]